MATLYATNSNVENTLECHTGSGELMATWNGLEASRPATSNGNGNPNGNIVTNDNIAIRGGLEASRPATSRLTVAGLTQFSQPPGRAVSVVATVGTRRRGQQDGERVGRSDAQATVTVSQPQNDSVLLKRENGGGVGRRGGGGGAKRKEGISNQEQHVASPPFDNMDRNTVGVSEGAQMMQISRVSDEWEERCIVPRQAGNRDREGHERESKRDETRMVPLQALTHTQARTHSNTHARTHARWNTCSNSLRPVAPSVDNGERGETLPIPMDRWSRPVEEERGNGGGRGGGGGGVGTPTHAHAHTHAHAKTHTHKNAHTQIHTYAHTHTHRHTDTQTHTHKHRQTDTHIHTHAHTYTHTPTHTLCTHTYRCWWRRMEAGSGWGAVKERVRRARRWGS